MKRASVIAVAAALALVACADPRSGVTVSVVPDGPILAADHLLVEVLDLDHTPPWRAPPFDVSIGAQHPATFDAVVSFTVGFDAGYHGNVEVDVTAVDALGGTLTRGMATVTVNSGTLATLTVHLPGESAADLATDAAAVDANFPVPDLVTNQFTLPDDGTPDLSTADLVNVDFTVPDFSTPDLATPDLSLPDFATPDLAPLIQRVVAWYHLDDGSDASGMNNSLTAHTGVFGAPGWAGGALQSSGWASASDSSTLRPIALTVEAWVTYPAVNGATQLVVAKGSDWQLGIDSGGHVSFSVHTSGGAQVSGASTIVVPAASWHHIAGTWDGGHLTVYLDGVSGSSTSGAGALASSSSDLTVGAGTGGASLFSGAVDEVRVVDNARSAAQILEDATLIAHYRLDDGSGAVAIDSSGYGRNATISSPVWGPGVAGGALSCDGISTLALIASDPGFTMSRVTLEIWEKGGPQSLNAFVMDKNMQFGLMFSGATTPLFGSVTATVGSSPGGLDGKWHQLAGTWDGKTNGIWLDGKLAGSGTVNGMLTTNPVQTALCGSLGSGTNWYQGFIDEVRIYNRALTAAELAAHFQSPSQ